LYHKRRERQTTIDRGRIVISRQFPVKEKLKSVVVDVVVVRFLCRRFPQWAKRAAKAADSNGAIMPISPFGAARLIIPEQHITALDRNVEHLLKHLFRF